MTDALTKYKKIVICVFLSALSILCVISCSFSGLLTNLVIIEHCEEESKKEKEAEIFSIPVPGQSDVFSKNTVSLNFIQSYAHFRGLPDNFSRDIPYPPPKG